MVVEIVADRAKEASVPFHENQQRIKKTTIVVANDIAKFAELAIQPGGELCDKGVFVVDDGLVNIGVVIINCLRSEFGDFCNFYGGNSSSVTTQEFTDCCLDFIFCLVVNPSVFARFATIFIAHPCDNNTKMWV